MRLAPKYGLLYRCHWLVWGTQGSIIKAKSCSVMFCLYVSWTPAIKEKITGQESDMISPDSAYYTLFIFQDFLFGLLWVFSWVTQSDLRLPPNYCLAAPVMSRICIRIICKRSWWWYWWHAQRTITGKNYQYHCLSCYHSYYSISKSFHIVSIRRD